MFRLSSLILAFCVPMILLASFARADGHPSAGAMGMPGAMGTIIFKPVDLTSGQTWWKDTDGIAPETPGCHIGTDSTGAPNGRMFGEACLENGLLVESNPGAYAVHPHTDDIGHPDTFDCQAWCIATGASAGSCKAAAAPPCAKSAMCVCE